ncbi:hypothetical protein BCR44DRAFT_241174 [Catenaria anguillulae PL171]|uniref:Uncharacterized protein n=1 Tax=Catenaria anguillulae PL171 TaxID=765915 RepID=A0A1Y2HLY4_9FUNG|nr:hypothetical protein BCR44DRAFT_241174 [Catenaria anguillulae PL171]
MDQLIGPDPKRTRLAMSLSTSTSTSSTSSVPPTPGTGPTVADLRRLQAAAEAKAQATLAATQQHATHPSTAAAKAAQAAVAIASGSAAAAAAAKPLAAAIVVPHVPTGVSRKASGGAEAKGDKREAGADAGKQRKRRASLVMELASKYGAIALAATDSTRGRARATSPSVDVVPPSPKRRKLEETHVVVARARSMSPSADSDVTMIDGSVADEDEEDEERDVVVASGGLASMMLGQEDILSLDQLLSATNASLSATCDAAISTSLASAFDSVSLDAHLKSVLATTPAMETAPGMAALGLAPPSLFTSAAPSALFSRSPSPALSDVSSVSSLSLGVGDAEEGPTRNRGRARGDVVGLPPLPNEPVADARPLSNNQDSTLGSNKHKSRPARCTRSTGLTAPSPPTLAAQPQKPKSLVLVEDNTSTDLLKAWTMVSWSPSTDGLEHFPWDDSSDDELDELFDAALGAHLLGGAVAPGAAFDSMFGHVTLPSPPMAPAGPVPVPAVRRRVTSTHMRVADSARRASAKSESEMSSFGSLLGSMHAMGVGVAGRGGAGVPSKPLSPRGCVLRSLSSGTTAGGVVEDECVPAASGIVDMADVSESSMSSSTTASCGSASATPWFNLDDVCWGMNFPTVQPMPVYETSSVDKAAAAGTSVVMGNGMSFGL